MKSKRNRKESNSEIDSPPLDQWIFPAHMDSDRNLDPKVIAELLEHNSITFQGKLVTYKAHHARYQTPKGGGKNRVFGMSNQSRLNLLRKLAIWDWDTIEWSLFLTLTYPDERAMPLRGDRNKHRYIFHRKLEAVLGRPVQCLWRVEYEFRKSGQHVGKPCPHWHMLLPCTKWICKDDVNRWWRNVIKWPGYARTETKSAFQAEGAAMYIGKYLSKEASSASLVYAAYHNDSGRPWGILREELIPLCFKYSIERLSDVESEFVLEFAEQFLAYVDSRISTSFHLVGEVAEDLQREFLKRRVDVLR